MRIMRVAIALSVLWPAGSGVQRGSQVSQIPVRRVEEEMRIVSNENSPLLRFSRIGDLQVSGTGTIFIADSEAPLIRVYDPSGRPLRTFGRYGQGPGEVVAAFDLLGTIGDTLLIRDQNEWSLLLFTSDGRYIRSVPGSSSGRTWAYLGGNRILLEREYWKMVERIVPGRGPVQRPVTRDSTVFLVVDSGATVLSRVMRDKTRGTADADIRVRVASSPGEPGGFVDKQPFLTHALTVEDPSARQGFIVIPHNDWNGQPGQIKLISVDGTGVQRERVINLEARRLLAADVNEWIRIRVDPWMPQAQRNGMPRANIEKQLRDSVKLAEYLPSADEVLIGRDGSVWIRPWWSATNWSVVLAGNTPAFTVTVPAGAKVMQVGADAAWATIEDSNGIPVVVKYRISPP